MENPLLDVTSGFANEQEIAWSLLFIPFVRIMRTKKKRIGLLFIIASSFPRDCLDLCIVCLFVTRCSQRKGTINSEERTVV
jgi:hypothetical protein